MSHLSDIARGIGEKRQLRQRIKQLEDTLELAKHSDIVLRELSDAKQRIKELENINSRHVNEYEKRIKEIPADIEYWKERHLRLDWERREALMVYEKRIKDLEEENERLRDGGALEQ